MQFAFISPVDIALMGAIADVEREMYHRPPMHLILAHVCEENPTYAQFFQKRSDCGDHIILDNGAYEKGSAVSNNVMERWIEVMRPTEVVLPDVMFDKYKTLNRTLGTHEMWVKRWPKQKFMVVPQGQDLSDWWDCFTTLKRNLPIKTSWSIFKKSSTFDGGRFAVLDRIKSYYTSPDGLATSYSSIGDWHLLGGDNTFEELRAIPYLYPWVRSMDSADPITASLAGKAIEALNAVGSLGAITLGWEYRRPDNYFNIKLTDLPTPYKQLIMENITKTLAWAEPRHDELT